MRLLVKYRTKKTQTQKKRAARQSQRASGRGAYRVSGAPNVPAVMQGRGGFWGDLWNNGRRYIPRAIGGAAGYLAGGTAGAKKGWDAGATVSRDVLGWGAYGMPWEVKNNTLMTSSGVPSMHNSGDSGVRLSHKEFLGPLYSSTSFTSNTYHVNPGVWATFPWLSQIAANFQQYILLGAMVVFEPVLPDGIAAFGSLGTVMIAAQMNPGAPNFASEIEMMQTKFVTAGKPSCTLMAPIECSPITGAGSANLLVRTSAVPSNAVIHSYDHCKITVATNGQPSANVMLGKLWLTADTLLLNPCAGQGTGVWGSKYILNSAAWASAPLGTSQTKSYDDFGLTFTGTTITFPVGIVGYLRLVYYVVGASGAVTWLANTLTNATLLETIISPNNGETSIHGILDQVIHITDSNTACVITFGTAGTFGAITSAFIAIDDVSSNFHV